MAQDFWSLMTERFWRPRTEQNQPQDSLVEEATQDIITDKVDKMTQQDLDNEAYNQMVENLGSRYGVSGDDMEGLMDKISFHESKRDASAKQIGGGPGRGLFQFESGVGAGGQTAMNRLKRWYDENQMDIPDWAAVSEDGVDASKLTPQQQKMLFMANTRYHPTASFRPEAIKDTADWWSKYHWAGDETDVADRLASFESDMRYA